MISNALYFGSIATIVVSIAVPVGCIIFSFKKGGTKGMPLFLLIGLAASMLVSSLGGVLSSFILPASIVDVSVLLYLALSALFFTVMDSGAKYLSIFIGKKSGMGFYKAFTLGTGYIAGKFLMNTNLYLSLSTGIKTFQDYSLDEVVDMQFKQNPDTDLVTLREELTKMRDGLLGSNPMTYFIEALGMCAIMFFDIALIVLLLKYIREKKTVLGILIVSGIRFGFSMIESVVKNLPTENFGNAVSEGAALIICAIMYAIMLAISIFLIIKLSKELPKEEKQGDAISPFRQQKIDAEKQAQKRAWAEFRNVNTKKIPSVESRKEKNDSSDEDYEENDEHEEVIEDEEIQEVFETSEEIEEENYEVLEEVEESTSRGYLDDDNDEA